MTGTIDVEQARFNMIEQQIRPWEVLDQRVLDTLAAVPRERYVPERYRALAFADVRIPLGHGQVMMNPNVEGRLLQALQVEPGDTVLEVGTGSGYISACLRHLGGAVTSVEIVPELSAAAAAALRAGGVDGVTLAVGDGSAGWGERRYDAIALTGSLPRLPATLREQLTIGGRLFAVIGTAPVMEAVLVTRAGDAEWVSESLFETELAPLQHAAAPPAFVF